MSLSDREILIRAAARIASAAHRSSKALEQIAAELTAIRRELEQNNDQEEE